MDGHITEMCHVKVWSRYMGLHVLSYYMDGHVTGVGYITEGFHDSNINGHVGEVYLVTKEVWSSLISTQLIRLVLE